MSYILSALGQISQILISRYSNNLNRFSTAPIISGSIVRMTLSSLCIAGMFLLILWIGACHRPSDKPGKQLGSDSDFPVSVEPILINQLGAEHFGNAIYRRGMKGPRVAASGNRILEWPIQVSAPTTEVVPPGSGNYENGACIMDLNGDSIDEMIVGRSTGEQDTKLLWYEEVSDQMLWKEHFIASVGRGKGEEGFHDIMPFEMKISDKLVQGVVIVVNRKLLYWYQIPADITQPWDQHMIADLSTQGAECAQSGLVIGDIAGNGRQDVVCGNFWAECPANPAIDTWQVHRYSNWDRRTTPVFPEVPAWVGDVRFGGMNQLDLGDMDGDGRLDIVASDAEIPDGRVGIFYCNNTDPRNLWDVTVIDTGIYCPHSLIVTDVNRDNLPDIIVGEMTAGGWWFPRISNPRLYLYLNEGKLKFRKFILHEGWGTHMMRIASEQPDDKIFVFAADEIQPWYKDMTTHVVGWTLGLNQ
ncbi:FG-GAP repeat domain-containing protein [Bacteroidota bacterium]